jgi:hypothetical protein
MPLATVEGKRREPGVGGHLLAIGEGPKQSLADQHACQLDTDAAEPGEQLHLRRIAIPGCRLRDGRVALGLDRLDVLEHEFEPLELAFDLLP